MKKLFILVTISILLLSEVNAQQVIAVQNGSSTSLYNNLDSAINYAQTGDTIYLPGGSFSLSLAIAKRLYIVGVGHNPDSTNATGRTVISSSLQLNSGADNGSVTGIYFSGTSAFYNAGQIFFNSDINGFSINRCYISGGISNTQGTNVQNVIINENIIGSYDLCFTCSNPYSINLSSPNQSINNNILLSKITATNSIIKNNAFLSYNPYAYYSYSLYSSNCTVENNIFNSFYNSANSNSTFRNNVNGGVNGVDGNGNQGSGNFLNGVPLDSIFVNYNSSFGWSYSSNFHLRNNSPYHNAGTDGTDIGIYGGTSPWKEGSIPFNPHISSKNIDTQNDANGNIRIRIKVKAQSN